MTTKNINQDNFIYPDYGVFFSKIFGNETVYNSISHRLFNITRVNETLYTSTSNIQYNGKYFCMSLDYETKFLKQILQEINDEELKARFKKELTGKFQSPVNVDFSDKPIELIVRAKLGDPLSNQNEVYIPFVALSFSHIKVLNENVKNNH